MINEVIFDCETQKLFSEISSNDPADLLISIVSVYVRTVDDEQREISGQMYSFWENELARMWPHFLAAKRIIGFNSLRFDVPALARHASPNFARLPHLDVMAHTRNALGFSLSLNAPCQPVAGRSQSRRRHQCRRLLEKRMILRVSRNSNITAKRMSCSPGIYMISASVRKN